MIYSAQLKLGERGKQGGQRRKSWLRKQTVRIVLFPFSRARAWARARKGWVLIEHRLRSQEKELSAWTESFKTVLEDPVWCKVDLQALFTRLAGQLRLLYLRPEVLDNLERLVREISEYWHRLSIDSKRKCVAAFNACVIMSRFLSDTLYETRSAQRAWSFYYVSRSRPFSALGLNR